jgi:hypothetical protein
MVPRDLESIVLGQGEKRGHEAQLGSGYEQMLRAPPIVTTLVRTRRTSDQRREVIPRESSMAIGFPRQVDIVVVR